MYSVKGYYKGCIKSGNIGDDILYEIFIKMLSEAIERKYELKPTIYKETFNETANSWVNTSKIGVMGGGTLIHNYEGSYAVNSDISTTMLFGTGVLPSFELNDFNLSRFRDTDYSSIQYLHNSTIDMLVSNVNKVTQGGLRGPISVEVIKALGGSCCNNFIYDAGILSDFFFEKDKSPIVLEKSRKNIGVNVIKVVGPHRLGTCNSESIENYNNRIFSIITEVIKKLLYTNEYNIYFYEMSGSYGKAYSRIIYNNIVNNTPSYKDRIFVQDKDLNFEDVLKLCSQCWATIGTRLHSNILSTSVDTPAISIAYSLKSIDFMSSIQLSPYAIPTFEISPELILQKVMKLEEEYETVKFKIKQHRLLAMEKYRLLFDGVLKSINIPDGVTSINIKYAEDHNVVGKFIINFE